MHTLEQLASGALTGTKRLTLSCGLTEVPQQVFDLADTLEILDLSGNQLSALPDLSRLHRLRILFASNNCFTELPASLGNCLNLTMIGFKANRIESVPARSLPKRLRWLVLTDNRIETLPEALGACTQLQKLMLAGNRLRTLPVSLAQCRRLELLRIAANHLMVLPKWLLSLPRLSWLAYAGNPCAPEPDVAASTLKWDDLILQQTLGEGASGVISRALLQDRPVAVKVFKGAVTSDGLPHSELAACLHAGQHAGGHPTLIPVLGRITGAPENRDALAMALIDPAFVPLAAPPSLDSCTRDVYDPTMRFSPAEAHRIAKGIASAMRHLHDSGIMHGDLYAHNILYGPHSDAFIGDFGAASFVPPPLSKGLQKTEMRAFGCLLEELAQRGGGPQLASLASLCLSDTPSQRPLFADMEIRLA